MSRLKDNLTMYSPLLVGLALFLPAAWKFYWLGQWEAHLVSAAFAVLGFISAAFREEVSSWTGSYRWTYETFLTYPPTYVRFFGFFTQICVLAFGFR